MPTPIYIVRSWGVALFCSVCNVDMPQHSQHCNLPIWEVTWPCPELPLVGPGPWASSRILPFLTLRWPPGGCFVTLRLKRYNISTIIKAFFSSIIALRALRRRHLHAVQGVSSLFETKPRTPTTSIEPANCEATARLSHSVLLRTILSRTSRYLPTSTQREGTDTDTQKRHAK